MCHTDLLLIAANYCYFSPFESQEVSHESFFNLLVLCNPFVSHERKRLSNSTIVYASPGFHILPIFSIFRIESIETLENLGNIQRKEITLIDNEGWKMKFLLWGEQVLLANLFRFP